jgi:hypothetical protein
MLPFLPLSLRVEFRTPTRGATAVVWAVERLDPDSVDAALPDLETFKPWVKLGLPSLSLQIAVNVLADSAHVAIVTFVLQIPLTP